MARILLVSLVSDQTIPNVQLIKQWKDKVSDYLFITTKGMEQKGTRKWIENASRIKGSIIEVNQFSFSNIEEKLLEIDFDSYDKIIVNITGGTKIMTLVAYDFFKNRGADIYYVTGQDNEYIKLFPIKKSNKEYFSESASLTEYLQAYGFEIIKSELSGIPFEQTEKLFKAFCSIEPMEYVDSLKFINSKRDKNISKQEDFDKVKDFLSAINYSPIKANTLSKKETKYLSGDWFEEYIGLKIKQELGLADNELFISTELRKKLSQNVKNDSFFLLGEISKEKSEEDFKNEMDVMFMYNNKFYSIECKSSIIAFKTILKNGEYIEKPYNILGETIYKSDSLSKRFGLFANTSILTLTDFIGYCRDDDSSKHITKIREMEEVINRANLSGIKLIDKNLLSSSELLFNLIK